MNIKYLKLILLVSFIVFGCNDKDEKFISKPELSSSDKGIKVEEDGDWLNNPFLLSHMQAMPKPISIDTFEVIAEPWDGSSEFEAGKAYLLTLEQEKIVFANDPEMMEAIIKREAEIGNGVSKLTKMELRVRGLIMEYDPKDFPENDGPVLSSTGCFYGFWADQSHSFTCYYPGQGLLKYYFWTHQPAWHCESGRKYHYHYGTDPNHGPAFYYEYPTYSSNPMTIYSVTDGFMNGPYITYQNCQVAACPDSLGRQVDCWYGMQAAYYTCP